MPTFSRVHALIDDDTIIEAKPAEAAVLVAEWNRHDQVALTFVNVSAVDRFMVALAEVRERLVTAGAA